MTHLIVLVVIALLLPPTATLTGRITDATGAPMADVAVQAINVETGVKWSTITNDEGFYIVGNLPPGIYRLILQKQGFRTVVRPDLELRVQDIFALNFEMEIGPADASITEQGGAPLLQAETATLGQIIDGRSLQELPILTKDPYDFVLVLAGASAAENFRSPGLQRSASPSRHGLDFAINGQREESVNFLLDGADANSNPVTTRPGQMIPLEAVREYRVLTNGFTAEYGRNAGFVANLVTKSGTNEWHGSVYEHFLNSALGANSFDNNANGRRKPAFNRHQPGGSLGGPVIPDKAFFFAAVESLTVRSWGETPYAVSPSPEIVAISSPSTQAVFRKYPGITTVPIASALVTASVRPAGGGPSMNVPFRGLAQPTVPMDKGAGSPQDTVLGTGRMDYTLNDRTTLTGRYAYQRTDHLSFPIQQYSEQYVLETDQLPLVRNHNATASLVRLWSTDLLTESRLTFSRLLARANVNSFLFNLSGWPMVRPSQTGGPRELYSVHQTASWLRRNHQFRFGGEIVHFRDAIDVPRAVSLQTTSPQRLIEGVIDSVVFDADYLANGFQPAGWLGAPVLAPKRSWHLRYNDLALFLQDTWKVTGRLTLTPGIRWEYFGVQASARDERIHDVNFYPGEGGSYSERFANGRFLNPAAAAGDYKNHLIRPDRNNFAPRLGLTFAVTGDGNTIFRTGAGIFYDATFGKAPTSITGPVTFREVPFTVDFVENPYVISGRPFYISPPLVRRVDPDQRTAYASSWNATIERELAGNAVISAAYVGASGSSLEFLAIENFNNSGRYVGRPDERLLNNYGDFETIKSLGHSSYHSLQLKAESREIRSAGLRLGANYTWSHSIDNASSRFEREFMGALTDPLDLRLDRGNSSFDRRQRFVSYFSWRIPRLSRGPVVARRLAEDWQVSGIVSAQSGLPFLLVDGGPTTGACVEIVCWGRPRVTGPLPKVLGPAEMVPLEGRSNLFLYLPKNLIRNSLQGCIPNTTPFACLKSIDEPLDNVLPRNHYRRPGSIFNDVAVSRQFRIGERIRTLIRVEFYNLFNHPNLELASDESASTRLGAIFGSGTGVVARYGGPARKILLGARIQF